MLDNKQFSLLRDPKLTINIYTDRIDPTLYRDIYGFEAKYSNLD